MIKTGVKEKSIPSVFVIICLFVLWSCSETKKAVAISPSGTANEQAGYKLVWADEFNKDGAPDSTSWRYEKEFVRNNELQWYQQENAWCENGLLVIEGRKDVRSNPGYVAGSNDWKRKRENIEYTSSSMNTLGKYSWMYGRFIMKGKIDVSLGLWPA